MRFLDYQKVRDVERAKAAELFGSTESPSALASKILGMKSRAGAGLTEGTDGKGGGASYSELSGAAAKASRVKLTEKEKRKVEELIRNAKSLQDITRLEKELNEGRVPREAMDLD